MRRRQTALADQLVGGEGPGGEQRDERVVGEVRVAAGRRRHAASAERRNDLRQDVVDDYTAAADTLRAAGVQVVLIQHEFGIFGGPNGSHVLALARALTERGIPYLVTLHTVLSAPTQSQAATAAFLIARAPEDP